MPELPEVEITRIGVESHFLNCKLTEVEVRQAQLRWPVDIEWSSFAGQMLQAVKRRSKYLLLEFSTGSVAIHLGMSGSLRVLSVESPWQLHEHLQFVFGKKVLRLYDPRRFGSVFAIGQHEKIAIHPRFLHLGVEPFSQQFSPLHLYAASRGKSLSCKAFLLQAKAVVGVGNIYASESLFRAGIRPTRAAGQLTQNDCQLLFKAILDVLSEAIDAGGSSLRNFADVAGELGCFQTKTSVYDRESMPCKTCKTPIRRITQNQRSTFYCSVCQPK